MTANNAYLEEILKSNYAISLGKVPGTYFMRKFGRNPAVDTSADGEDIWDLGDDYTFQTTAQEVEILANAADVLTSGLGAWTVEVQGLDANWAVQTVSVDLNGATPVVLTATTWIRIFRMRVTATGSNGVATGPVTLRISGGGATMATINAGLNQTTMAIYAIPADHTGLLLHAYGTMNAGAAAANREGNMMVQTREFGSVFQEKVILGMATAVPFNWDIHNSSLMLPEKMDIKMRAFELTAAADISAVFEVIVIPNSML